MRFNFFRSGPLVHDPKEAQEEARLEDAEREVTELQDRASKAIKELTGRHRRDHWHESIEKMIKGAP